jgi:hypothetical protein
MGAQGAPEHQAWGTTRFGKSIGDRPSVYNTIRVPFTKRLRITSQLPSRCTRRSRYWLDLFGVEGLPVSIGGGTMLLPPKEYRLRSYTNLAVPLKPQATVGRALRAQLLRWGCGGVWGCSAGSRRRMAETLVWVWLCYGDIQAGALRCGCDTGIPDNHGQSDSRRPTLLCLLLIA